MWTGIHRFNVISHPYGRLARMAVAARTNYFKPPHVAVISNRNTWLKTRPPRHTGDGDDQVCLALPLPVHFIPILMMINLMWRQTVWWIFQHQGSPSSEIVKQGSGYRFSLFSWLLLYLATGHWNLNLYRRKHKNIDDCSVLFWFVWEEVWKQQRLLDTNHCSILCLYRQAHILRPQEADECFDECLCLSFDGFCNFFE